MQFPKRILKYTYVQIYNVVCTLVHMKMCCDTMVKRSNNSYIANIVNAVKEPMGSPRRNFNSSAANIFILKWLCNNKNATTNAIARNNGNMCLPIFCCYWNFCGLLQLWFPAVIHLRTFAAAKGHNIQRNVFSVSYQ